MTLTSFFLSKINLGFQSFVISYELYDCFFYCYEKSYWKFNKNCTESALQESH